ncbi:hypothetical protein PLICRDRAFT_633084 [Plicaturopsis crispa FD-325 SS-3]|nr:hypothetical protein PLICRDRAFT_633084 [Plicaturopsis crispa FD-325 SS-3]
MSVSLSQENSQDHGNSLYAALARTATRSVALYFSRPMRLFRPAKVSGWQSMRGLAMQHGESLTPKYMYGLVKQQGFTIIAKHFIPPIMINAALGTILWTTYSETSAALGDDSHLGVAALSGAAAGGAQAVFAAPAENVRLVLEGGRGRGWSHAWKEVFRGTEPPARPRENLRELRQVRHWMHEVGEMAGRGWDGWGWGCAKDVCGFAAFFTVFEITRRIAVQTREASQGIVAQRFTLFFGEDETRLQHIRRHFPRTVYGLTLVTGGVIAGLSYELVSRPFDFARKAIHLETVTHAPKDRSVIRSMRHLIEEEGVSAFFKDPSVIASGEGKPSKGRAALRTLGRVGPWGLGFLVWEAFGPGLS